MALTRAKVAQLRKRMLRHGVKGGRAVVELTAKELQDLLDAADRPVPSYKNESVPVPKGEDPRHLYEVTIVVMHEATGDPDHVVNHVMSACLNHPKAPLEVVNGYGVKVKNLTLCDRRNRSSFGGGMVCTGYTNKPVPKNAERIDVIKRAT